MKRMLLVVIILSCTVLLQAQLVEDFSQTNPGWIFANGFKVEPVNGNDALVSPAIGGNNPGALGTPVVDRISNTMKVCFDIFAYKANLKDKVPFPCASYVDIVFTRAGAGNGADADNPLNEFGRVNNLLLPTNGGNICYSFTFPAGVPDTSFRVFFLFHADCVQGGIRYVIDNVMISGVGVRGDCSGGCAPVALPDRFTRINPGELSFNAVLYGSNNSFPPPPAGYAVDAGGTDSDPDDTYTHLHWALVTPPVNGTVTVNSNGTATIARQNLVVSELTFTYRIFDDGLDNNFATTADNLADTTTVTVLYPAGAALPVSLVNFSGNRNGQNVVLKWTTTSETNNKGFEIQKMTAGGTFITVGYIASLAPNGYCAGPLQYEYTEMNNSDGVAWYRLVQVNQDGAVNITPAKAVRGLSNLKKMLIYPNPGTYNNMNVLFGSSAIRDIMITGLNGRIVKRWNSYHDDNLSITGLLPGVYMLIVTDKGTLIKTVEKLLIAN